MKFSLYLGLFLSVSLFAARVDPLQPSQLRSSTLAKAIKLSEELHKSGEEFFNPAGGRRLGLWYVSPSRGEKEWETIRDLTDELNTFGHRNSENYSEEVTAYKRDVPTFSHVNVAFASDRYDRDDLEEKHFEYASGVKALRDYLRTNLKKKASYMAFYRIFSSNEAQGHLGWVLYNRGTNEALYVSTVSDH